MIGAKPVPNTYFHSTFFACECVDQRELLATTNYGTALLVVHLLPVCWITRGAAVFLK